MNNFAMPSGDLLIAPEHATWTESLLAHIAGSEFAETITQEMMSAQVDEDFWEGESYYRPYNVKNGTLTIPVQGMLMPNFPLQVGSFATGYEYILAAVTRGVNDQAVTRIVFEINSPGGLARGMADCTDAIYELRGDKPMIANVNEHAYSAAYAIASAADTINVARTGGVGSVGVISAHYDVSKRNEQMGIKITHIFAGDRKADGNMYEPLSDRAKATMQERADALYDIFVALVARNRGMEEQAVRDTEAATYLPRQAVEIGLADSVGALGSTSANADPFHNDEEDEMSTKDTSAVTQAALDEAVATATATATETGKADGMTAGASAERTRIAAIMDSDEGKARPKAARHVALNSAMSAEDATAFLAGLDEEKAAETTDTTDAATTSTTDANGNAFTTAMENGEPPALGANGGAGLSDDEAFLAEYRGLTGKS